MSQVSNTEWGTLKPTPLRRKSEQPSRLIRWTWRAGVFILLAAAAMQLILPPVIGAALERAVARSMSDPAAVNAQVRVFPAVEMLFGRLDHLSVRVRGGAMGGVPVSRLELQADDVLVDVVRLWKEGRLDMTYRGSGLMEVAFSTGDINNILQRFAVDGLIQPVFSLEDGRAVLAGRVTILGNELALKIPGSFSIKDNGVEFVPENVQVEGYDLGPELTKRVLRSYPLKLPVELLPAGMHLQNVRVEPGELVLIAITGPVH